MKKQQITARNNWIEKVENLGLVYHHTKEGLYWNESAVYYFSQVEFSKIQKASEELHRMCLLAVDFIIEKDYFVKFGITNMDCKNAIIESWNRKDFHLYGRFDLSVNKDCSEIKMLEYNADTPTSILEVGLIQPEWKAEFFGLVLDNSFENKIINRFKLWNSLNANNSTLDFLCVSTLEDMGNTNYLRECAEQSGVETSLGDISFIKWHKTKNDIVNRYNKSIKSLFKLYPWEWIVEEDTGKEILKNYQSTQWVEPIWKMLLSNKAILPVLWEIYPEHPYLLEAYFDSPKEMEDFVSKPLLSREGANVVIYKNREKIMETLGEYKGEVIYQKLQELPDFEGGRPVIGSWIIGDDFAGIGIRESTGLITDNYSQFIPSTVEF
jgi:glutathionylspermidine synthase